MSWLFHLVKLSTPYIPLNFAHVKKKENLEIRFPKRGGQTKEKLMMNKKNTDSILMLQYRIKRYQAMGYGIKCQDLISELNQLQKGMVVAQA